MKHNLVTLLHKVIQHYYARYDMHLHVTITKILCDQPIPDIDRFVWPGMVYSEIKLEMQNEHTQRT